MVGYNVMKWTDPLVSLDVHNAIIPPSPTPVPLLYGHISFLGHGALSNKAKFSGSPETIAKKPILTLSIQPMLQGTDTGFFDVHIGNPANVLLPITIAFSSSKSLFVASTVQMNGSPTAAAVLIVVNINLNCNFPVSLPTGYVVSLSTVQAGMSIGDILAGIVSGVLQIVFEKIVGAVLGSVSGYVSGLPISRGINQSISQLSSRLFIRSVTPNIHVATPLANALGKYFGTSNAPFVTSIIASEIGEEISSGLTGILMDQTPVEDGINSATTGCLGAAPNDCF